MRVSLRISDYLPALVSVAGRLHERGFRVAAELKIDSVNGVNLNVLSETVDAIKKDPELGKCKFRARNKWAGGTHNASVVSDFYGAGEDHTHLQTFEMHADEPPLLSGRDEAANPVEHLLHALASCVTTSLVAHAAVKSIHIEELESELEGDIDLNGSLGLNPDVPKGYTATLVELDWRRGDVPCISEAK